MPVPVSGRLVRLNPGRLGLVALTAVPITMTPPMAERATARHEPNTQGRRDDQYKSSMRLHGCLLSSRDDVPLLNIYENTGV